MSVQQMTPQQHKPKHTYAMWVYWTVFAVTLAITLALVGLVIWLSQTQKIDQLYTSIGILAGIAALIFAPLIFFFTVFKKPEPIKENKDSVTTLQPSIAMPSMNIDIPTQSVHVSEQNVTPSSPIWNVPYRRNPFFTGREQLLKQLRINLTQNNTTALTQAQAINGLGGIGKTQIAIEYAYRHREDYQSIFWVNADTREGLIADYVTIANRLQLPGQNERDQMIVVAAVKNWLATHNTCLLILDNADDLTIIDPFLPTEYTCHILLTTREQTAGIMAKTIEVDIMNREEGTLMLLRRAKVLASNVFLEQASKDERTSAENIVLTLGGLPLALDQAGAYIEENDCTLTAYLQAYSRRQTDLLTYRGKLSIYHADPVATTWSLSFEQVEQHKPLAADLMRCCAFLAPDDIPEEFFTEGASKLSPLLQPIEHDSSLLDEALGTLRGFSLVRRNRDTHTFSIHRLVQAIMRTSMDTATQQVWAERTVRMVNQVFPGKIDVTTWKQCQRSIAHAQTCATAIEHYHFAFPEAAALLNKAGRYLYDLALYSDAEPLYQRALQIREQVLGPEHPDTATSLNNLAGLYQSQGKYEQAEPLYQRAIAIMEKMLGTNHPNTITVRKNYTYFLEVKRQKHQG